MSGNRLTLKDKLLTKSEWQGECLIFTGHRDARGYGFLRLLGRHKRAHRIAYEISKGPIPDGMIILHSCDNPSCINPEHLTAGTQQENVDDMLRKGRANKASGETHCRAKLTASIVAQIRASYSRYDRANGMRAMARKFGVSKTAIRDILIFKNWKSLA